MKGQPILDRVLSILSAVLVPVMALLVHHGVISSQDAVDIGAVWAAAVGSFHAGTAVQRARSAYHVTDGGSGGR